MLHAGCTGEQPVIVNRKSRRDGRRTHQAIDGNIKIHLHCERTGQPGSDSHVDGGQGQKHASGVADYRDKADNGIDPDIAATYLEASIEEVSARLDLLQDLRVLLGHDELGCLLAVEEVVDPT